MKKEEKRWVSHEVKIWIVMKKEEKRENLFKRTRGENKSKT